MADPGFWNDQEQAREVIEASKELKAWVEPYERLAARVQTAIELEEMLAAEPDDDMEREVEREAEQLDTEIGEFELRSLLRGEADHRDAQVEIAAGAGGTEAQDWAQMLMRMYTRWAERKGFDVEILDLSEGEEAGIKGATLEIHGSYAFG